MIDDNDIPKVLIESDDDHSIVEKKLKEALESNLDAMHNNYLAYVAKQVKVYFKGAEIYLLIFLACTPGAFLWLSPYNSLKLILTILVSVLGVRFVREITLFFVLKSAKNDTDKEIN